MLDKLEFLEVQLTQEELDYCAQHAALMCKGFKTYVVSPF